MRLAKGSNFVGQLCSVKVVGSDHTSLEIPRKVKVYATVRSNLRYEFPRLGRIGKMATQLCQKCKQAHPGRVCDYDEKAECAETIAVDEVAQPHNEPSKKEDD